MLLDIDKTGSDADRWFLAHETVEGLPPRAGYYFGYLFSKCAGDDEARPALARVSPRKVHEEEIEFLTQLAHSADKNVP